MGKCIMKISINYVFITYLDHEMERMNYISVMRRAVLSSLIRQVTPSQASQVVGAQGSPFHPILPGTRNDSFNAFIALTTKQSHITYKALTQTRQNTDTNI
jgi:hypothetical protein